MLPTYLGDRASVESASHKRSQHIYLGHSIALCRVLGKYKMYVDTRELGIVPHLCLEGFWESWITVFIARTVQAGWSCLDVGANFGYYTMLMADAVGPDGRIAAIEPNPDLVSFLRKSVSVNGFAAYTDVVDQAASDSSGREVELATDPMHSLNGSLFHSPQPGGQVFGVKTVSVDDLTEAWPRVDFIKVDAEGAEETIWQGMTRTIDRNPALTILLEFNAGRYSDPAAFVDRITQKGFALRYVGYDSEISPVTLRELLDNAGGADFMLLLKR